MEEQDETCVKNFIRLKVLMTQACGTLRKIFKEQWERFSGEAWLNSPTYGNQFITSVGRSIYRKADPLQRKSLENGDINTWDLLILSQILLEASFEKEEMTQENTSKHDILREKTFIQQLVDVQLKMSYDSAKAIDEKELLMLWNKVVTILTHFGYSEDELDELRFAENIDQFEFGTPIHLLTHFNVEAADRLKERGNTEFNAGNLDKALQHYTEAINLSDISDQVLGTLYSNRAAVYINKVEKLIRSDDKNNAMENALANAQSAVDLCPNWWKGHFRLGRVFEKMGELKKAVFAFDCALVLNPVDEVVRKACDNCRTNLREVEIKEFLCLTRLNHCVEKPLLKKIKEEGTSGIYIRKLKEVEKILAKKGDPRAYVLKAHRLRYLAGNNKPDYEIIATLYEKAASEGSAEGMFNLAMLMKEGLGVGKDIKRAVDLLNQAADEPSIINGFPNIGVSEAQHVIGVLYMEGDGLHLNPEVAIQFFQRSCDNGNGSAAYALGKVYVKGLGVKMDEKRGLEYWKLAASRKVVEAMESLYEYFLEQLNPEQANKWFTEALENGSTQAKENRKRFQESLNKIPMKPEVVEVLKWEKENGLNAGELPLIERYLRMQNDINPKSRYFINELISQVTRVNHLKLPYGGNSSAFDFSQVQAFAEKGSKTAQRMHSASEHFAEGIKLLKTAGHTGIHQAIHHFAECYRLESIVAVWSADVHKVFVELVKHLLGETSKNKISSLDRDLSVCYAHLTTNNLRETIDFIDTAIARYPDERCLYALQVYLFGFLTEFKEGLVKAKNALKLFPNDVQLLNTKANSMKFLDNFDVKDRITAFEDFLKVAEIDDRGVPDAHYIISFHYSSLVDKHRDARSPESKRKFKEASKLMMKHYKLGLEAERIQLPCFLPFNSEMKRFMGLVMEMEGSMEPRCARESEAITNISSEPAMPEQMLLTDPMRVQIIKDHRQMLSSQDGKENKVVYRTSQKPCQKKKIPSQGTGLKVMTLRDMNPKKKCVYKGFLLKVTSIEDAIVGSTSIQLLVQDEKNYVQRCLVYNFTNNHDMQEKLGFGCKFSFINPDVRVMKDGKPAIVVDAPMSQLLHSDRDNKGCRFCGKGDSSLKCSRCRKAFYCSKECQTRDWKLLKHALICTNIS